MKNTFLFACAMLSALALSDDPAPVLKASTLTGKWMLDGSVKAVRFDLKQNGTFEYKGYGSESKGRWNVEGCKLRLRWTFIDSVQVDAQKVTGLYAVEEGALKIGKFEYRKGANPSQAPSTPQSQSQSG